MSGASSLLSAHRQPLLNVMTLHEKPFLASVTGMLLMQFICLGIGFLIPNFSQLVTGETAFRAGCILLPGCILGATLAPVSGRLYDRFGAKLPLAIGRTAILLSQIAFTAGLSGATTLSLTITYVVFTLGQGLTAGNILTYGLSTLGKTLRADGNAVFNTSQQLAGALGTAICDAIVSIAQTGATDFTAATAEGTGDAFHLLLLLAVMQGVSVVIALRK